MASLLNNASLLLNPAGSIIAYEEDKILSVLPRNGTGDFTFSGGDGGTRVNQQGYVVPTPANLLNNTNTFSSWNLEGGTLTGGFPDPEGGNTAYKYTAIGGNGLWSNNVVFGVASGTGGNYPLPGSITFSFWIKSVTGNNMTANIGDGVATSGGTVNITGTWQYITRTITPLGPWGGFYLSGLSDATNGYYIWHPQINIGSTALPYQPTTDRLNYPRITYQNGRGALLSEPQRTNLNLYSQGFDNAYWNKQNASITASAGISPDGTNNAFKLNANTSAAFHIIFIGGVNNGQTAVSVFAKKGEYDFLYIRIDEPSTTTTYFNLANGTVGTVGSGHTAYIEPYKDGWYRCTTVFSKNIVNYCLGVTSNEASTVLALEANKGIYIWGSQVEAGEFPTSYIPTTSATVTRPYDQFFQNDSAALTTTDWTFYMSGVNIGKNQNSSGNNIDNVNWSFDSGGGPYGPNAIHNYNNTVYYYDTVNGAANLGDIGSTTTKFAVTKNGTTFKLFRNGVLFSTNVLSLASNVWDSFRMYGTTDAQGQAFSNNPSTLAILPSALSDANAQALTTVRSGSGGNISYYGPYTIHTFTGSATFTPSFNGQVEVLVVAGGGGGGGAESNVNGGGGGGGGAGGLLYVSSYGVSAGTGITVTIGAGGSGGTIDQNNATNGSNSVFGGLTAIGGGRGGADQGPNVPGVGGSGGGAGGDTFVAGAAGIAGQGNKGGDDLDSSRAAGGGGGAGAAGQNSTDSSGVMDGTAGGDGLSYSITGFSTYYAGGGGGGGSNNFSGTIPNSGLGGLGGGGNSVGLINGTLTPNTSGVPNTGGGGGGGANATTAGNGGSGIVIVRYLT
jgi:hypothetical protein